MVEQSKVRWPSRVVGTLEDTKWGRKSLLVGFWIDVAVAVAVAAAVVVAMVVGDVAAPHVVVALVVDVVVPVALAVVALWEEPCS